MRACVAILLLAGRALAQEAQPSEELADPPEATPALLPAVAADDRSFALRNPLQLGASVSGGATAVDEQAVGYVEFGLGLAYQVDRYLALGISQLYAGGGVSSIEGFLFAMHVTPFLEASAFVDPNVQTYGRVGLLLEGRTETAFREGAFQAAPYLSGGVRLWLTDWFSIGIEIGLHLVLTNELLLGSARFPQWSVPGTATLAMDFHLAP